MARVGLEPSGLRAAASKPGQNSRSKPGPNSPMPLCIADGGRSRLAMTAGCIAAVPARSPNLRGRSDGASGPVLCRRCAGLTVPLQAVTGAHEVSDKAGIVAAGIIAAVLGAYFGVTRINLNPAAASADRR